MSVSNVSTAAAATATTRGTKINNNGSNGLDRNAFLKILTTELSNQDPSTPTDSTQYVAQLAQFSSLEQMQNLNDTMTFNGASGIIGKNVNLNVKDSNQNFYTGLVSGVNKNSNGVFIHLLVTDANGNILKDKAGNPIIQDFPYSSVADISSLEQNNAQLTSMDQMQNLNDTMAFNGATGIIGKNVKLNVLDSNKVQYTGLVKGVNKNSNGVFIHLQLTDKNGNTSTDKDGNPIIQDFLYSNVAEITA